MSQIEIGSAPAGREPSPQKEISVSSLGNYDTIAEEMFPLDDIRARLEVAEDIRFRFFEDD